MDCSVLPIAGRLADGKSHVPALVLSFLPDFVHASRPVVHSYLCFSGMSASELLSECVTSGGMWRSYI